MNIENIIEFDEIVGSNLVEYIEKYSEFESESLPLLINFFKGRIDVIDSIHNNRLVNLLILGSNLSRDIIQASHLLQTISQQEVAFFAEELVINAQYFNRIDKFSRSTTRLPSTTHGVVVNHTITRGTLEKITEEQLGKQNFDNDWVELAKYNDLYEVDYDYNGGKRIDLILPISSVGGVEDAIVDYMFRENLLGKDIKSKIEFFDDDFLVLSTEKTFLQSVEILGSLEKGDVPEFPRFGRTSMVGQPSSVFGYASLVRQLRQVFASDPTVTSLQIAGYSIQDTDVSLQYSVTNIRDEIAIQQSITI